MSTDRKTPGLKGLQGLVWESGYASGELKCPLYSDALEAIKRCSGAGGRVYIYSSGSRKAQHLLFKHTESGDIRNFLSGYFDTTSGGKKESGSYVNIAATIGIELGVAKKFPTQRCVFVTDVTAEAQASADSGFETFLIVRPDNPAQPPTPPTVQTIHSFDELW